MIRAGQTRTHRGIESLRICAPFSLHALDSLLESGAPVHEDLATSSRVYAINRSGFRRLLDEAAAGDTIRLADTARLFHSTKGVIHIREVLQRRGLHLHIATDAWSGFGSRGRRPADPCHGPQHAGEQLPGQPRGRWAPPPRSSRTWPNSSATPCRCSPGTVRAHPLGPPECHQGRLRLPGSEG
ncbi:recombinase family protein [Streptomyces bobili]|uniref:recombinase family protein n=1 Tax=Streptomyces bobili TaxID=67280 RepID=UPI0037FF35BC